MFFSRRPRDEQPGETPDCPRARRPHSSSRSAKLRAVRTNLAFRGGRHGLTRCHCHGPRPWFPLALAAQPATPTIQQPKSIGEVTLFGEEQIKVEAATKTEIPISKAPSAVTVVTAKQISGIGRAHRSRSAAPRRRRQRALESDGADHRHPRLRREPVFESHSAAHRRLAVQLRRHRRSAAQPCLRFLFRCRTSSASRSCADRDHRSTARTRSGA